MSCVASEVLSSNPTPSFPPTYHLKQVFPRWLSFLVCQGVVVTGNLHPSLKSRNYLCNKQESAWSVENNFPLLHGAQQTSVRGGLDNRIIDFVSFIPNSTSVKSVRMSEVDSHKGTLLYVLAVMSLR